MKVAPELAALILLASSLILCPIVHPESKDVSFDLDSSYVSATLAASITVPDGTVELGKSTPMEISITANRMTISLSVPNVGTASVDIDPFANQSYPIPGLYHDYGLVKLGLTLRTKGTIEGQLYVEGNGTLDKTSLTWTGTGTQSVTLNTTAGAKEGQSIDVFLQNVKYALYVGVKAEGEVLGQPVEVDLIAYSRLGSIVGSPSSVSGTYEVGYFVSFGFLPWVGVAGLGSASCIVGYLYFKTKNDLRNIGQEMARLRKTEVVCSSCKTKNAPGAKFCRKCGEPL